jgi:F0F1-type ATP synthase membrane subunit b/b'
MKKLILFILILIFTVSVFSFSAYADTEVAEVDTENESFYGLVYSALREHSEKILSALAAIASLLLAFTYRRGLMPTLKGALEKMCEGLGKIKTASEKQSENASLLLSKAEEKLEESKEALTAITKRLEELEEKLSESLEGKDEREKMKIILSSQTDMLYDIFMSSALPQYQKDMVGERTLKIKEELKR